jgi:uncharacterized membrane protein YhaH (DUF805 family)
MPPYLRVLARSFDFAGRSPRGEFWWFTLVDWLLLVLLLVVDVLTGTLDLKWGLGLLGTCYLLLTLPARMSLVVRRLHDLGQSGWWVLLQLVPPVNFFVYVAIGLWRGERGENRFGQPDGMAA